MILGKPTEDDMSLRPIQYQWAYDLYQQAVRNTWFPHEIPLKDDLDDWNAMTKDEKHSVSFIMGFFNPAELIINRSIAFGMYPYLKRPEMHLYLAKQMWEEANHCVSFEYVLETFGLDKEKIYKTHQEVVSMKAKEDFISRYMNSMVEDKFDIDTIEGKKAYLKNLIATNMIFEGIYFYSGFVSILSFRQRNKLKNFGSMINWVLRDESLHLQFGINLIHSILEENKEMLTEEFAEEIRDMIIEGVDLEIEYNKDLFPKGILGLNADYINQYVKYVADRRLEELGLAIKYNVKNPAKWMAGSTDVLELVNFFEMQNTNYEVNSQAETDIDTEEQKKEEKGKQVEWQILL